MICRIVGILMFLTACAPQGALLSFQDQWTGIETLTTREHEVFRDTQGVMLVRPAVTLRGGQRAYGIVTRIYRLAPNGPIIEKIVSDGQILRYRRTDRLLTQCMDSCRRTETGVIHLTQEQFRTIARTGLRLQVFGRRGRYFGTVPPEPLRAILAHIDALPDQAAPMILEPP